MNQLAVTLADIRSTLERHKRVVIVQPGMGAKVTAALADLPNAGLIEVRESPLAEGQAFIINPSGLLDKAAA